MAIERVGCADKRLKVYSGMTDAQLKECYTSRSGDKLGGYEAYASGLFIAESRNVISRALAGGYPLVSLFLEEKWLSHEMPLIQQVLSDDPSVPVLVVSHEDFVSLTGYRETRGALACFERLPLPSVRDLCASASTVAMALEEDSISLDDPALTAAGKLAVVLGTEGEGLRASTIEACDHTVMIPMEHEVDSLNVAAASAVALWELRKHKRA